MRKSYRQYAGIVILLISSLASHAEIQLVGQFADGLLVNWDEKSFKGHTQYSIVMDRLLAKTVLQAHSQAGATGLIRNVDIDLTKTPYLNWSWKITKTIKHNNEQIKEGDDYPARIYIVTSGGLAFWKTRALNYVWSSHHDIGQHWPSAYTGNSHMVTIQSGTQLSGQWQYEKRNIHEDFETYFGKDINQIHVVAIMTDTDNTGADLTSFYGDISFTSQ
ncbi:MAG: DUF3047 domain-containing protein [Gammaproteobacteria bacterium]|nr:DUF3047 domain-containing protein [Gammaproteobacteria bacterium]